MQEDWGKCYICGRASPAVHEHHVIPQFAGGEEGPTVKLDGDCHTRLHAQALNLVAKKAKRKQYFTPAEMEKAAPLLKILVAHIQQTAERMTRGRKIKVMVELPENLAMALHMLKMDAGRTNLADFCVEVLVAFARSRL